MKHHLLLGLLLLLGPYLVHGKNDPNCGLRGPKSTFARIVNGVETEPHQYPWMVSMQYELPQRRVHFCGASIISDRWLLTAAHCNKHMNESRYNKYLRIVAGK